MNLANQLEHQLPHKRLLYSIANKKLIDKSLTEDVLQDLHLNVWNYLKNKPKDVKNVKGYLIKALYRLLAKYNKETMYYIDLKEAYLEENPTLRGENSLTSI